MLLKIPFHLPTKNMTSTYRLVRILQHSTVYRLMMAEVLVFALGFIGFDYLHRHFTGLDQVGAYLVVAAVAGLVWLFLRLSRTPCTVSLDEEGFSVTNERRFHLLSKAPMRHRWSEFSYQSGARGERQNQGYEITIHLKSGKSISFLTGTSSKEMAKAEQLHQDIERRVAEFQQNPLPI